MKIVLTSVGSAGDVVPFLALAVELKQAGHQVKMLSNEIYRGDFEAEKIKFASTGVPMDIDRLGKMMMNIKRLNKIRQYIRVVDEVVLYEGERLYNDVLRESKGFDFAVCHTFDVIGQHAILANRIPWAAVIYCPGMIPTAYSGPMEFPNLGKPLNRLLWQVAKTTMWPIDHTTRKFVKKLNGHARKTSVFGNFSPFLNLVASSGHVCEIHPDLPETFFVTGEWYLHREGYTPPNELIDFIRNAKPDVAFTFGSVSGDDGQEIAKTFVEAARKSGLRAIIQRGWANIETDGSQDHVFFAGYIPHEYLFKHVRLVVHHGSAGSTLAACREGVASVVVDHIADQKYYGITLHDLGVGTKPIPRAKMTSDILAKHMDYVLKHPEMIQKARMIGAKIKDENGPKRAMELIEQHAMSMIN
ncbi:MAG: glycosyltransferase [Proteobacteria bacterium]|nr:glycosyltransferase [Pseudomonadota bacterium]